MTVLFADLAGSTALGSTLDAEDVRVLQGELFELIGTEVERFGGVMEKFVGDAVLAVFGIPQAHEDDAERGVRAALAVHERFGAFAAHVLERFGAEVGLRIAVNTGDVVSSREAAARGELMVSGDPVNVAARLQQHAQPGEILVGERTWSVTRRTISYGAPREVDAKGKPVPVRAWATAGAADDPSPADIAGLTAPLIGRESELAVLTAVCSRVAREPVPQLVMLYGQAGVGKSRLLDELLGRLEGARVLEGRCLPYGQGSPYWALAEAAKGHAGILDTDPNDVAAEKLRGAIEPLLPAERAAGVLEAIAWTIGLSLSGTSTIASDAREAVRRSHSAWAQYLGALGRKSLVVLVLEDVHWASAALLDLVDYLAETVSDTRLLLVCSARPELLETRPTWGAGKQNVTAITIGALSPVDTAWLVASLLGQAIVAREVSDRVLATAEGNPFFVEEMLHMLVEQGALERRNGDWIATERLASVSIPDSVHGAVAARIDLLEAPAREALRRCSVVGRVFWPAAVDVDEAVVASLGRRGLVSDRPESVMAGMREFAFKHSVTRDVAYSTLPRGERRVLHRRVAEWVEGVAPDRAGETTELAAYHYGEAITYGDEDPALARRAFELFAAAGAAALDRGASDPAEIYLRRALELAKDQEQLAAAQLALVRLEIMNGSFEQAVERLDEVERLLPPERTELRSDALGLRSRACWLLGRWDEALSSANNAVALLAGLPESRQLARALARRSQIEMLRSVPEAGRHAREAILVAQRVGDAFAEVNSRINSFTADAMHGVAPGAAEALAIVDASLEAGAPEETYRAIVNFTWSASGYLPVSEIEQTVAQARERATDVPPPEVLGPYLELSTAMILLVPAGRWDEVDQILAAVREPDAMSATNRLAWLALVAGMALRRGDLRAAELWLDELRPAATESGEPQRIIPMACVALPWAAVSGEVALLRSWSDEILEQIEWSDVLSAVPIARAVATVGDNELLARLAASLGATTSPSSSIGNSLRVTQGLQALADGNPENAVSELEAAVNRERELGHVYTAACLDLDLAAALEAMGAAAEAAATRAGARSVLDPLGCVNPF